MYEVIIVGAGPAGLNAALILGRCNRSVLLCDAGYPRNAMAQAMHGFLTRDGIRPQEIRQIGREQLAPYKTVDVIDTEVTAVEQMDEYFDVSLKDGSRRQSRKILLATGVTDVLPDINGFNEFYGRSIFHCPYCDGWEFSGQPIAIYGKGKSGHGLSLEMTGWSRDLALCTNGEACLDEPQRDDLHRNGIRIFETSIERLEGEDGKLRNIVFVSGERLSRNALFLSTGNFQRSKLPEQLGCVFSPKGGVMTGRNESTNIPGLYVAGDASGEVHFAVVAAAEGARAAHEINTVLIRENLK